MACGSRSRRRSAQARRRRSAGANAIQAARYGPLGPAAHSGRGSLSLDVRRVFLMWAPIRDLASADKCPFPKYLDGFSYSLSLDG